MDNKTEVLQCVFQGLMMRYTENVPDVKRVTNALIAEGVITNQSDIENDHVAFRTMGVAYLGITSLEKIFLHLGYEKRDYFSFEGKKLNAYWYSPPEDRFPRIFISELRVEDLPEKAQTVIRSYTDEVQSDPVDGIDLNDCSQIDEFLHSPLWRTPTKSDYEYLLSVSEYAAWVIYNRYYLNHYTISVHNFPEGYNTIEEFNPFLERHEIVLNTAGGKAKISGDGLLIQSSTVAAQIEGRFANEEKMMISGSYVEFAERKIKPEFSDQTEVKREHRRDGFETGNADKIFESTYTSQTKKKNE